MLIFAHSSVRNALAINQVLHLFHSRAGEGINKAKCSLSFSATSYRIKRKFIRTLGFREVQLLLKYWGLHLVSTRLRQSDCLPSWTSSIAELAMFKSGFSYMPEEWSSSPQCLQAWASIGRLLSGFRRRSWNPFHWAFGIYFGQAPNPPIRSIRSAELVQCRPKDEGGLGLRTIEGWNGTAMLKLFRRVVNDNGSIWTPWVNYRYLRRHSIWVENIPSDCS